VPGLAARVSSPVVNRGAARPLPGKLINLNNQAALRQCLQETSNSLTTTQAEIDVTGVNLTLIWDDGQHSAQIVG
jgi:hypothetical protein